ncbi:MAG: SusD/RagB family nutrient-binding outer membrane lipoprotein [Paludibacter sp.]
MKKIKNIIKLSLLAVVITTSSCSDFLDINKDPNRVTDSNVTPELIFTQAENAIGTRQATRFVFMNNWMGYWARSGTFIVEQEETTYKVTSTFTEGNWDQAYNILFDLYKVKNLALTAKDSVLAGSSIILSVKLWQETVDQFGAIPYTQTFDHLKYPTPVYDRADSIYADLVVQLDKAISYLQATPKPSFAKADMIFARGDAKMDVVPMWIKLANTIKLRIFLRQSEKGVNGSPFTPTTAQIAKISADGGFLGAGENVAVNPGYSNQTDKQNPFYAAFGFTPSGSAASTNNKANAYYYNLISDDRYAQFYATPVTPTYYGALNGNKVPGGSQIGGTDIGPGLAVSSTQDQWILPSFESLFFQAEAIARGWITGDVKATYESAITESFVWLGVPDAVNDAKASLADATLGLSWDLNAGTTPAAQVEFIAYNKYLSLNGIDAMEEWADLRRGVLVLPAGYLSYNAVRATHLPYVLPYPQTEVTVNKANLPTRTGDQLFTEKLFWQP